MDICVVNSDVSQPLTGAWTGVANVFNTTIVKSRAHRRLTKWFMVPIALSALQKSKDTVPSQQL